MQRTTLHAVAYTYLVCTAFDASLEGNVFAHLHSCQISLPENTSSAFPNFVLPQLSLQIAALCKFEPVP